MIVLSKVQKGFLVFEVKGQSTKKSKGILYFKRLYWQFITKYDVFYLSLVFVNYISPGELYLCLHTLKTVLLKPFDLKWRNGQNERHTQNRKWPGSFQQYLLFPQQLKNAPPWPHSAPHLPTLKRSTQTQLKAKFAWHCVHSLRCVHKCDSFCLQRSYYAPIR
jgi:hypothetical protein